MGRQTIDGYAIVQRKFGKKTLEVKGIGTDTPAAWADAAENMTHGRVAARDMYREFPSCSCVSAKITVTFDNQN